MKGLFARILGKYNDLPQAFASGDLTIDEEVKIRAELATILVQEGDRTGQKSLIYDAIHHVDTILRRLPPDSLDRPKHLSKLSYLKVSEYAATHSRRALNDAVLNGRRARDLAVSNNLLQRDSFEYFDILNNCGYALSQRYALLQEEPDLEEAIACARETHDTAAKDSLSYIRNLNNLASRLRLRYNQSHDENDINHALRLINELQSNSVPGTEEYSMATAQISVMGMDKFNRTNKLEDLNEALVNAEVSLDFLPGGFESRLPLLTMIVQLYRERYKKTAQIADLRRATEYSKTLFQTVPLEHAARGRFLLDYLMDLRSFSTNEETLETLTKNVREAQSALRNMSRKYHEKKHCQAIVADIFFLQYDLTHNIRDLLALIEHIQDILDEYNRDIDHGDPTLGMADTAWIQDFKNFLNIICNAQPHNVMRSMAESEILEQSRIARKASPDSSIRTVDAFYRKHNLRLQVLCEAIQNMRVLSSAEIDEEVKKLQKENEAVLNQRNKSKPLERDDYTTELGLRKLAITEKGEMILDLRNMMEGVLGYDVEKNYTAAELASVMAESEQNSLDTARQQGRHPNLSLCRMCRDYYKVIQPTSQGFELTAEHAVFPFGNYFQLRQRKHCSICSLVLSLITTSTGALHPKLAAIDPEVQGVRMSLGTLATNEKVLRIDYGMKFVGELRIVTMQNKYQALRQAHEMVALPSSWESSNDDPVIRQTINPSIVNKWLSACDNNHGSACNHARSEKRAAKVLSLNFIDVQHECLVAASSDEKYFALSYTWGRVDMCRTLKSNYEERRRPGALVTVPFPSTIRDAMRFVRSLGERYLWVDAICLVQDDEVQMARDIPNMDVVYGQAFATIVALVGSDANAGLAGVRDGTRLPQKITTLTISENSPYLDDDPSSTDKTTICLVATPRDLKLSLELSQWNTRGWIVQEHLLSRRCLYFAPDALYFKCGEETLSEGGCNEQYDARMMNKHSLDVGSALGKEKPMNPIFSLGSDVYDLPQEPRLKIALHAYSKLVNVYSERNLSFKSDILNAFSGMFSVLEEHFQSTTFHGLPAAVFSHALLWTPAARLPRRGAELPTNLKPPGNPDPQFPSWSWVGWDGPVDFRMLHTAKGELLLPTPTVNVYETASGPIRDALVKQEASSTSTTAGLRETAEQTPHDSDDTNIDISTPQEQPPQKQIIAKIVPDKVRQSSWIITAPIAPEARNDVHIASKLLQFTARTVCVNAFQISPVKEYLSLSSQRHIRSSQAVRRVKDRHGNHCGLWWEQAGYGYVGLGISKEAESKIDMLEISRYGDVHCPRDGPYLVEGPISMFDEKVFPAVGRNSGLVNILVIDLDMGLPDGIGERCTVAVIHAAAWDAAHPQNKEVRMV